MELNLVYLPVPYIGYGRSGIDLEASLAACGVAVLPLEDGATSGRSGRSRVCSTVLWLSSPDRIGGWWEGQYRVILTMYETLEVPEAFRAGLADIDRVLVPSLANLETFSSFHPDVAQIDLGIDSVRWRYRPRPPVRPVFRFLTAGNSARKGGDLAARAFTAAFPRDPPDGPPVELVMKVPAGIEHRGRAIRHVTGRLSASEEVALYASAHCFLAPSRGEGFGLQPLQAIAQGCPTVLTAAHGHARFADLGIGIGARIVPAGYFSYGPSGEWWEPDLDELVEAMRSVYADYDAACAHAAATAGVAAERFSLEKSGESVVGSIGSDRLAIPYSGPRRWRDANSHAAGRRAVRERPTPGVRP